MADYYLPRREEAAQIEVRGIAAAREAFVPLIRHRREMGESDAQIRALLIDLSRRTLAEIAADDPETEAMLEVSSANTVRLIDELLPGGTPP